MGMYVLQGEYVEKRMTVYEMAEFLKTLDIPSYKMTVTAMSDGTITTNEVFQFVLADIFKKSN